MTRQRKTIKYPKRKKYLGVTRRTQKQTSRGKAARRDRGQLLKEINILRGVKISGTEYRTQK